MSLSCRFYPFYMILPCLNKFSKIQYKEINEIKINSILKNTKNPTKFGVQLFQGICFIFSINCVLEQRK